MEAQVQALHTPGPWAWQDMGGLCLVGQHGRRPIVLNVGCKSDSGGMYGAYLRTRNTGREVMEPLTPENPDARLIAAAPELLEACERAACLLGDYPESLACVRAAIAKAKGY